VRKEGMMIGWANKRDGKAIREKECRDKGKEKINNFS
jgi:hypothetical protein